jgi:hypothetical protein
VSRVCAEAKSRISPVAGAKVEQPAEPLAPTNATDNTPLRDRSNSSTSTVAIVSVAWFASTARRRDQDFRTLLEQDVCARCLRYWDRTTRPDGAAHRL